MDAWWCSTCRRLPAGERCLKIHISKREAAMHAAAVTSLSALSWLLDGPQRATIVALTDLRSDRESRSRPPANSIPSTRKGNPGRLSRFAASKPQRAHRCPLCFDFMPEAARSYLSSSYGPSIRDWAERSAPRSKTSALFPACLASGPGSGCASIGLWPYRKLTVRGARDTCEDGGKLISAFFSCQDA